MNTRLEDIFQNESEFPIYKICITGGPCAGKKTGIEQLQEHLESKGYKVFVTPDITQLTDDGGALLLNEDLEHQVMITYVMSLVQAQIDIENHFLRIAKLLKQPTIVLYNKGIMDIQALVEKSVWQSVIDMMGFNEVYLRDKRYDIIIHMLSTAQGLPQYFYADLDEDEEKPLDIDTAKQIDVNIQNAWLGHPHHLIIGNKLENFEQKINCLFKGVDKFIGITTENSLFKKFLVQDFINDIPTKKDEIKIINVEEVYLKTQNKQQNQSEINNSSNLSSPLNKKSYNGNIIKDAQITSLNQQRQTTGSNSNIQMDDNQNNNGTKSELRKGSINSEFSQQQNLQQQQQLQQIQLQQNQLNKKASNEETGEVLQYSYIRKRGSGGAYTYSKTDRLNVKDKQKRKVIKQNISASQYIKLFQNRDLNTIIFKKQKYVFIYNNVSYVLERFKDSKENIICILKVDSVDIQEGEDGSSLEKNLPNWVRIEKEITNLKQYSGLNLGKKQ